MFLSVSRYNRCRQRRNSIICILKFSGGVLNVNMDLAPYPIASSADANSSRPLVSIIMPVHNAAPYLADAINSILSQTYRYPISIRDVSLYILACYLVPFYAKYIILDLLKW